MVLPSVDTKHSDELEADRAFFERELDSFMPERLFDAHAHLWPAGTAKHYAVEGFEPEMDLQRYRQYMDRLHPGRQCSALFLPMPDADDVQQEANAWVAAQAGRDRNCRGAFFVKPGDDPEWVRQEMRRLGVTGLKCYHTKAAVEPTWEAEITDYLPETIVKVAHEEGWHITLHMVRRRALADASNVHWLQHFARHYPNAPIILAHAARGFQPAHNLEGLPAVRGLDNLWFDTSANCEPMAHIAILKILGHERLMYGSDFHVSHERGRSVEVGDSFLWLYGKTPVWNEKHNPILPPLVGHQHLRSLKWACWTLGLSDTQVEDIFYGNAARLFALNG